MSSDDDSRRIICDWCCDEIDSYTACCHEPLCEECMDSTMGPMCLNEKCEYNDAMFCDLCREINGYGGKTCEYCNK